MENINIITIEGIDAREVENEKFGMRSLHLAACATGGMAVIHKRITCFTDMWQMIFSTTIPMMNLRRMSWHCLTDHSSLPDGVQAGRSLCESCMQNRATRTLAVGRLSQ